MELSEELQDLLQKFKNLSKKSQSSLHEEKTYSHKDFLLSEKDELVDVSIMDLSDPERWLVNSDGSNNIDLQHWLYEDTRQMKRHNFASSPSLLNEVQNLNTKKNIDTRTFTRPKKKSTRPSIEKYNEELFNPKRPMGQEQLQNISQALEYSYDDASFLKPTATAEIIIEPTVKQNKPLHFDLSQPTSGNIFDNLMMNSDVDLFQNMSPPSFFQTSMSSSTFSNLMESSLIQNDPVLRKIRDETYTEELLTDFQAPLFQSITESCSSFNSDTPEGFLVKTLGPNFNNTFTRDASKELSDEIAVNDSPNLTFNLTSFKRNSTKILSDDFNLSDVNLDVTYKKELLSEISTVDLNSSLVENTHHINDQTIIHSENIDPNATVNINTTPKFNGTYRKSKDTSKRHQFQKTTPENVIPTDLNKTITKSIENQVVDTSNEQQPKRKLSYIVNDLNKTQNGSTELTHINDLNQTITAKRNSFANSTGSADSLDNISNISFSSKGSNKMLNMEEVDALIESQEKSLQLMSTPKPAKSLSKLWEAEMLSPIVGVKEHASDSELSSTDEYATVRSSLSKVSSINSDREAGFPDDRTAKSLGNLVNRIEGNPRSINTLTKGINSLKSNITGSYSNLKTADSNVRGSYSNLKSISTSLKGSYTNLKPVYANLPHATKTDSTKYMKPSNLNATQTLSSNETFNMDETTVLNPSNGKEVFKVPLVPKESSNSNVAAPAIQKPQVRPSGLPRPVGSTGIPRPVSKIPGPRLNRAKSVSSSRTNLRPSNRTGNY